MGFKETLHNIVHREEFDHRPTLDELKEEPLVGGDIYPQKLQEASNTIDRLTIPADFKPWKHTHERVAEWKQQPTKKHQTQLDDGEEWC